MPPSAIVYDCEFLAVEGSPRRFWCAPHDPDPVIVQIGAVRLPLDGDPDLSETFRAHILPKGREGESLTLSPFFEDLTGITNKTLEAEGAPLAEALRELDDFSRGAPLWSWGKDEFNMIAISCYVQGLTPPLPIKRFGNACSLFLRAGVPQRDVDRMRSNTVADDLGIEHPPLQAHDALDDALSVAYALQQFLRDGRLSVSDFVAGRTDSAVVTADA